MEPEIIYKHIKNGYARINPQGNLQIYVPAYLRHDKKFLQELREKGEKLLARYKKRNHIQPKTDEYVLLFGEQVPIQEISSSPKKIDQELKHILHEYAQPILDEYSKRLGIIYREFKMRKVKAKWGSCTHDQIIMLNTALVHLPTRLIMYVIIHEICHLKIKDHSPRFRKLVEIHCPNYKLLRKELRNIVIGA